MALFECFYDSPPTMPATVSKPIPRLFSPIIDFLLLRPVHVGRIVNSNIYPCDAPVAP